MANIDVKNRQASGEQRKNGKQIKISNYELEFLKTEAANPCGWR